MDAKLRLERMGITVLLFGSVSLPLSPPLIPDTLCFVSGFCFTVDL